MSDRRGRGILLIGTGFMGVAHAHAWSTAAHFFPVPAPRLVGVVARDAPRTAAFAESWGFERWGTDLDEALHWDGVDLVDVTSPNVLHHDHALAALAAGFPVTCEKPLAHGLAAASAMAAAARRSGLPTYVWFNYRRVPAVALARRLVAAGRIGRILQVRAAYLQSWGLRAPHSWRFDVEQAGSGAHGDINAHIVDMVRFVTGLEIEAVDGAVQRRVVDSHPDPSGAQVASSVDDVSIFLARLANGATATFEASRVAFGYLCAQRFEIHGDRGALRFDFERMNELAVVDGEAPLGEQGWTNVHVTRGDAGHPYVDRWWPEGHGLGYDHTFVHHAADVLAALDGRPIAGPLADFEDALRTERVLHAASVLSNGSSPVTVHGRDDARSAG